MHVLTCSADTLLKLIITVACAVGQNYGTLCTHLYYAIYVFINYKFTGFYIVQTPTFLVISRLQTAFASYNVDKSYKYNVLSLVSQVPQQSQHHSPSEFTILHHSSTFCRPFRIQWFGRCETINPLRNTLEAATTFFSSCS